MNTFNRKLVVAAISAIFAGAALAQGIVKPMVISTGSTKGAYNPMMQNVVTMCALGDEVSVLESGGSIDNHNNIFGGDPKATSGVFQYDFALYQRERDPRWMNNMVVVARLHDEYVQIVALNKPLESGGINIPGFGRVGGKQKILTDFDSLKGQTVFAWGGSFYSANVLSEKFGLNLKVVDLSGTAPNPDGKGGYVRVEKGAAPEKVAAMLVAQGEGVAIIAVGAPNLGWLNETNGYGKQWKLLPVSNEQHAKVGGTYGVGRVSYLNLAGGQVQTLTVPALLMTRSYQTPARVGPILKVQTCIRDRIAELRDEGNNNWLNVDPEKSFDGWRMFEAPSGAAQVPKKAK